MYYSSDLQRGSRRPRGQGGASGGGGRRGGGWGVKGDSQGCVVVKEGMKEGRLCGDYLGDEKRREGTERETERIRQK